MRWRRRRGATDEVVAKALPISLRAYRRQVAEIMRALGADPRFQAGAQADRSEPLPHGRAGHG